MKRAPMLAITMARKPLSEKTVAGNVLRWGTGAINVQATRIGEEERVNPGANHCGGGNALWMSVNGSKGTEPSVVQGRWPANVILQHYAECRQREDGRWICARGCPAARRAFLPPDRVLEAALDAVFPPDPQTFPARCFKQIKGEK